MSLLALTAALSVLAGPGYVPSIPPEWEGLADEDPDFDTIPLQAHDEEPESGPKGRRPDTEERGRGRDTGDEPPADLFPDEDDGEEQLQAGDAFPRAAPA